MEDEICSAEVDCALAGALLIAKGITTSASRVSSLIAAAAMRGPYDFEAVWTMTDISFCLPLQPDGAKPERIGDHRHRAERHRRAGNDGRQEDL